MKWFLIGLLCLSCSATSLRADPASDLYNDGLAQMNANKYDLAAADFKKVIDGYPTFQNIDNAHILAGQSYFYSNQYAEAVAVLERQAGPDGKPEVRGTALFLTALAQFYAAQKIDSDKSPADSERAFGTAITSLRALIDYIKQNPTPDNKAYLEQAYYFRALANYQIRKWDAAEDDLKTLTTDPQFAASLSLPDYLFRLGACYASQANDAIQAKKSEDEVTALANQALAAFDRVINDPNALVDANDASKAKADLYFLLAQMDAADPEKADTAYGKALDAFRQVRRKADLIVSQQARLDQLRKAQADNAANRTGGASYSKQLELTINREQGRLDTLNDPKTPDPIIDALIRMAEVYVALKQPDEARTILHRLVAHAKLTDEQQQDVDFQTLYSYVLGGQTAAAEKALIDYRTKHSTDPNLDSIRYQIALKLKDRKDYDNALKEINAGLTENPKGRFLAPSITLKAQILTAMGKIKESSEVVDDFLKNNPTSPEAYTMILSRAANEAAAGDLPTAAADYAKVKDVAAAGAETQAAADIGYIQTLLKLQKFDEVVAEAKAYETKYPTSKQVPYIMLFSAQALNQKNDPGAVAALQDVARKFPKDEIVTPLALYYVIDNYRRANNEALMIQAAKDLQTACPTAYPQIILADDAVSAVLLKEKKFADAAALYEPLTRAPDAGVAADAQNKIGDAWFASARTYHYQSLPPAGTPGATVTRADAEKALAAAESAYLAVLKNSSDQLNALGNAMDGLVSAGKLRHSWGLLKEDTDVEGYLAKLGADFSPPDMKAHFELAEAGLVFYFRSGAAQFPAALDRFKKVMAASPDLQLTRQETENYGELLLAAKDYDTAAKIYGNLLASAPASDTASQGYADYGLGAVALAQSNLPEAKKNFLALEALPGGGTWHPHIADANFGIALADEASGTTADVAAAMQIYGQLMKSPQSGNVLQAKALIGYGRLLEKQGFVLKPSPAGPNEYAVHYYLQVPLFFSTGTPDQSAEGLYLAGKAYAAANDTVNAKKQYDALIGTYAATAPEWVAKAKAAEGQ